jgi:hypothetical protein
MIQCSVTSLTGRSKIGYRKPNIIPELIGVWRWGNRVTWEQAAERKPRTAENAERGLVPYLSLRSGMHHLPKGVRPPKNGGRARPQHPCGWPTLKRRGQGGKEDAGDRDEKIRNNLGLGGIRFRIKNQIETNDLWQGEKG